MPPVRGHLPIGLVGDQRGHRQGVHARRRMLVLRAVRGPLSHGCGDRQHALSAAVKRLFLTLVAFCLAACGVSDASGVVTVVIGYQSRTINTVTAGTLLRSLGYLEKRLGPRYRVVWQDYSTGAPITAEMVAGKIDIG